MAAQASRLPLCLHARLGGRTLANRFQRACQRPAMDGGPSVQRKRLQPAAFARFGPLHTLDRTRTLLLPFDRPRSVPSTSTVVVTAERWLRAVQRAALEAAPFGGLFPAAAGRIDLHPYQMEPALAALRDGSARILIADAVGLGKTVQAGLLLRQLSSERDMFRGLVVVPASLREQWSAELEGAVRSSEHRRHVRITRPGRPRVAGRREPVEPSRRLHLLVRIHPPA